MLAHQRIVCNKFHLHVETMRLDIVRRHLAVAGVDASLYDGEAEAAGSVLARETRELSER